MATPQFSEQDWYETPAYYDIIFSADTELECDFMAGIMQRHSRRAGRRVLEPACGSGRLVTALARRGYDVTGFDISDAMLEYAQRRLDSAGLRANLQRGRMESFAFAPRFDLAHCLVSTFKYLLDEASARAHLQCVAKALHPGGLYVLGFHLSDYDDLACSRERWFGERDGASVICNIQSWPPERRRRLERVRSRLVVKQRGKTLRTETNWLFRAYNVRQMRRLLASVPTLQHVATYDFAYDLAAPREFTDNQLDCVLILRRGP